MTSARRRRKLRMVTVVVPVLLAAVASAPWNGGAATTEQIVVDSHTGLAISGFDPVAYFTDGRPIFGRGEFEVSYGGAVWRFINEGNRAAFAADPQVYMPRFGGYDPVSLGRGVGVPGHPQIFHIAGQRLYLFSTRAARASFVADPERSLAAAERKWPEVLRTLSL